MDAKIQVTDLVKIFGRSPKSAGLALDLLNRGTSKDEILARTGSVVAISDATLSVAEGEMFMVMGLSGSGKSTLVRCLNRLIEPTSGTVHVDGDNVFEMDERELRELRRTRMSMVFQNFALLPHKTVLENVEYGLKVRGEPGPAREAKAAETLALVGLAGWEYHYPDNLSGGMQQRLGLARALANDPDILLMDEPFSALDPLIRNDMQNELLQLQGRLRKTIVFITHDFQEAIKLGDRIAIMKDGEIVQVDRAEVLVAHPADDYVANFTSEIDRGRVFTAESIMHAARATVSEDSSVGTASRRLNGTELDCAFVVDPDGKPVGYIQVDDLQAAAAEDRDQPVRRHASTDFNRVAPGRRLVELYGLCRGGAPLAVVDEAGRFLGQIDTLDILSRLAAEKDAADDAG